MLAIRLDAVKTHISDSMHCKDKISDDRTARCTVARKPEAGTETYHPTHGQSC